MLDKFKRLIPELSKNIKNKLHKTNKTEGTEEKEVSKYKYINYEIKNPTIIDKIWQLRNMLDYFDAQTLNPAVTTSTFSDMLDEISEELGCLAFSGPINSEKAIKDMLSILNFKNQVDCYHQQYLGNLNTKEDYFHNDFDASNSIYEKVWCLSYMFDCGCVADNIDIFKDVNATLKDIYKNLMENNHIEYAQSIKNILKMVKAEQRDCFFRNLHNR